MGDLEVGPKVVRCWGRFDDRSEVVKRLVKSGSKVQ